ncbi:hypothetical protein T492DRAFT_839023 [Pavlovales sp. CCMP2436]|nr:hypothetical protein T492DRAFT_839023 [Pavlovales sp. CCMP2436]
MTLYLCACAYSRRRIKSERNLNDIYICIDSEARAGCTVWRALAVLAADGERMPIDGSDGVRVPVVELEAEMALAQPPGRLARGVALQPALVGMAALAGDVAGVLLDGGSETWLARLHHIVRCHVRAHVGAAAADSSDGTGVAALAPEQLAEGLPQVSNHSSCGGVAAVLLVLVVISISI